MAPKDLIVFGSACDDVACLVGRLLAIERIVGRAMHLRLLVWDRDGTSKLDGVAGPLHVDVATVTRVDEASGLLIAL